jgi:hypothetical protein
VGGARAGCPECGGSCWCWSISGGGLDSGLVRQRQAEVGGCGGAAGSVGWIDQECRRCAPSTPAGGGCWGNFSSQHRSSCGPADGCAQLLQALRQDDGRFGACLRACGRSLGEGLQCAETRRAPSPRRLCHHGDEGEALRCALGSSVEVVALVSFVGLRRGAFPKRSL